MVIRRVFRRARVAVCLTAALFSRPLFASAMTPPEPPKAKKVPKVTELHGERLVDNYYWLREKGRAEVIAHLEAENAYTGAVMRQSESLQKALYDEMLRRIKQTDTSAPVRDHGFYYYSRTTEGQQYPIYCRRRGSLDAPEEITLDLNELARGEKFMALGAYSVSDDGRLLAYSTDNTGFRQYKLRVKDLTTGEILPELVERVTSVAWAADTKTIFYTVEDDTKRSYRLYRHPLGDGSRDELVYEEKDELFRIDVHRTRSREFLLLDIDSHTTSEVRYLRAWQPGGEWKVLSPREHEHEYSVEHHGGEFYIRTNSSGRNFSLVSVPVEDPRRENWKEIIPHRQSVMLESMGFFANHYVLAERENGLQHLRVTSLSTGASHRIDFPEPAYAAYPGANPEFDTTTFRFNYESMVTPPSVFDYDVEKRERKLVKQTEVLGGYDSQRYLSERLHARAVDGTRIPISIVYRKGLKRDGSAPLLLYGYGSYGFPLAPTFSSNRLSLLDRGVVFAIAHIRGGGEMGKVWHDQGRMMHKKNTFTDFISAAEYLIAEKFTSKPRLVIEGGSAGGLLVGAVTNMRPDLFHAVVALVPFVDVVNTMLDTSLPLTVGEFEEWGNPHKKAEYDYIRGYSPYDNVERKAYPTILVRTSLNDSQVMYWEPAKYVAKLREMKTDRNLLLFRINMSAGHGGSSGRYDALKDTAFDYAFILGQLGIAQ